MIGVFAGAYGIASGVDVVGIVTPLRHPFEADEAAGISLCFHLIIYGVCRIIAVDIDIGCLLRMKLWGKQVIIHRTCTCDAYNQDKYQYSEKDLFFLLFHVS